MNSKSTKVLIRGVNWIGDAVMTIPAIRAIRMTYKNAHIALLVKPWVSEIFQGSADIDEIILYDDRYRGITGKFKLAGLLREKNFDNAILLQNAFDAALITWLAGIQVRSGYARDCRSPLLTKAVPIKDFTLKKHQVYYYLDLLESLQIKADITDPYMKVNEKESEWAVGLINASFPDSNGPLIGINPGAAYGSAKRWPSEKFAALIDIIITELNGRIVIFGSHKEIVIANEITGILNNYSENGGRTTDSGRRILNMAGRTSLRELAAIISECDSFITNDSGPMHMAHALFIPTVSIFGSTNPVATGPFGAGHKVISRNLPCAPCMERECPEGHLKCMTEISESDLFNALKEVLPKERAVFFDKDGTLIEDKNYLNSFDDLTILDKTKESLARLKEKGFKLIGITNQSGIGRKIVDEDFVIKSNSYLEDQLDIDHFFYCPHHPDDHCPCRKPEPMMVHKAKLRHRINLRNSYVIGDKESDVLLSRNTGITGILLSPDASVETCAAFVAKDISDAADWIIGRETI